MFFERRVNGKKLFEAREALLVVSFRIRPHHFYNSMAWHRAVSCSNLINGQA